MMAEADPILSFARLATALLAGTISMFGLRAYLRTGRRSLLALSLGAGVLAAGYFAEGLLVELAGWTVSDATVVEAVTTLFGAAILVVSLYMRDSPGGRGPAALAPFRRDLRP